MHVLFILNPIIMNYKLFQILAFLLLSYFCFSTQILKPRYTFIEMVQHASKRYRLQEIQHSDQYQQLKRKIMNLQNVDESKLDLSVCSKSVRDECNLYAKNILKECQDSDSQYCWKQLTLVYPKCLRCYCNQVTAQTCRAANIVLYEGWRISDSQGCDNLLQKQCTPLILAEFLMVGVCEKCMCRASKKGYETYFSCSKNQYSEQKMIV